MSNWFPTDEVSRRLGWSWRAQEVIQMSLLIAASDSDGGKKVGKTAALLTHPGRNLSGPGIGKLSSSYYGL
jgi:hypothetical protein